MKKDNVFIRYFLKYNINLSSFFLFQQNIVFSEKKNKKTKQQSIKFYNIKHKKNCSNFLHRTKENAKILFNTQIQYCALYTLWFNGNGKVYLLLNNIKLIVLY